MKKYTMIFIFAIFTLAVFSGCTKSQNVTEPSSSHGAAIQTTMQSLVEGVNTTESFLFDSSITTTATQSTGDSVTTSKNTDDIDNKDTGEGFSEDIVINVCECSHAGGKRMVDWKVASKDEFLKKYPIILPGNFATVDFYYEIPTEDGLRFNEVESGYIRCKSEDGRSSLHIFVCKSRYVGNGCVWHSNNEPKQSRINKTNVIINKHDDEGYWAEFEKNGYYYTIEALYMDQGKVISALNDLVN